MILSCHGSALQWLLIPKPGGIVLTLPPDAETYRGIFKSIYITRYLGSCVDEHTYNGQSLRNRFCFGIKVRKVSNSMQ